MPILVEKLEKILDLPWNSEISNRFITNVGLITSDGHFGSNVMACEWTYHISYRPGLIAVCIRPNDATHENIRQTKEFGVNRCSTDQSVMSSVAATNPISLKSEGNVRWQAIQQGSSLFVIYN